MSLAMPYKSGAISQIPCFQYCNAWESILESELNGLFPYVDMLDFFGVINEG
jgi:hypothetical protein